MIFVNRPYLIEVNEVGQIGSKIELFVWNGATVPSTPTYTFTKDAPSTTDLANYYNISPFVVEYIQFGINDTDTFALLDDSYFANIRVKRYKNVAGTYTLLDSTDYKTMYGDFGTVNYGGLLAQDTYYTEGSCSVDGCDTISVTYQLNANAYVNVSFVFNGQTYNYDVPKIEEYGPKNHYYLSTDAVGVDLFFIFEILWYGDVGWWINIIAAYNSTGISYSTNFNNPTDTTYPIFDTWTFSDGDLEISNPITTLQSPVTVEVMSSGIENGKNIYVFNIEIDEIVLVWDLSWLIVSSITQATLSSDTPCPFGVYTIEEGSIFSAFSVAPSGTYSKFLFPLLTNTTNKTIRWTDLYNGATTTETLTANKLYVINGARYANGTKVDFLNNSGGIVNTWTFLPQCECVYEPIKVQYLNTYGAFITTWFYKANKKEFSVENSEFKRFQTVDSNFYVGKQRQTFNTIGREKITVNSGWVSESYSQVIKDILMSEYTLVLDQYANVDTKSIEIYQNINNGLINYQLSFTYSNDYRR